MSTYSSLVDDKILFHLTKVIFNFSFDLRVLNLKTHLNPQSLAKPLTPFIFFLSSTEFVERFLLN